MANKIKLQASLNKKTTSIHCNLFLKSATLKACVTTVILLVGISCKKDNTSTTFNMVNQNSEESGISTNNVLVNNKVQIGTQIWMTKNLDVSRYRNGDEIPQVTDVTTWVSLTSGAWCYYNNDTASGALYGKLYNWYAVTDPRGLAPKGWHVPGDVEWTILSTFLGGVNRAGGKMKERGKTHWLAPNKGATDSSHFTGLPSGSRQGPFFNLSTEGDWWSSTENINNHNEALYRYLGYNFTLLGRSAVYKWVGASVRCIKD